MSLRYQSLTGLLFLAACSPVTAPSGAGDSDADIGIADAGIPDAEPEIDAIPPTIECEENPDCGDHALCLEQGQDRICACAPGYEGDNCDFAGLVQDPGFSQGGGWEGTRGAVVNLQGGGIDDPGDVLIDQNIGCNLPSVFQNIEMPPADVADAFVVQVTYESLGGFDFFDRPPPLSIGFNNTWTHLPDRFGSGVFTERVCLGDAAYGQELRLELAPKDPFFGCPNNPTEMSLRIDSVDIVPAGLNECLPPGALPNGDMSNDDNWNLSAGNNASASFQDGAGLNGTRALVLQATNRCSGTSAAGPVSIPGPDRVPDLALEFDYDVKINPTSDGRGLIRLGELTMASPLGGELQASKRVCIPPELQGLTANLLMSLSGGSGLCADVVNNTMMVDNLRFVSDPRCAHTAGSIDSSFEYAPLDPAGPQSNKFQDGGEANVRTISDSGLANSGDGVLLVSTEVRCASAGISRRVAIPPDSGNGGPALRMFANVPPNPVSTSSVRVGNASLTLPENGDWTEHNLCIPPQFSGRTAQFSLTINGGSGSCSSFGGTEQALFDDLEFFSDPACPSL